MQLEEQDKNRLTEFYSKALLKFGPNSAQALNWNNSKNQLARFDALTRIADLNGKSILDFGCGVGDLYGFLSERFINFKYTGLDIVPEMTAAAKVKYPAADFQCRDISSLKEKYDYILSSGALTFNVSPGKQFYFELIKKLYDSAKSGVAFNMLDSRFYDADSVYLTYSPTEVSDFCETFAPRHEIVFGYISGDFTVYLLKP